MVAGRSFVEKEEGPGGTWPFPSEMIDSVIPAAQADRWPPFRMINNSIMGQGAQNRSGDQNPADVREADRDVGSKYASSIGGTGN